MRKFWFPGLVGLLMLILAACGSSATAVPAAKQAPAAPAAAAQPAAPAAAAQPAAPAAAAQPAAKAAPGAVTLADAAAKLAGKPGAVYTGKLQDLAGPAISKELGDADGNVPLAMLEKNPFPFQTDYYKSLIEKANLTNPTQLVTSGQKFKVQYACINRALAPCKLAGAYFLPNVLARTNGQVEFQVTSYPELGIAGPDFMDLVKDGSVGFGQVQPAYVGGTLPIIDIIYMWGLWDNRLAEHTANTKALPILDKKVSERTGDGKVVFHIWYGGNDQWLFSKKPLLKQEDFKGYKARSHGTTMSDYLIGLGGEAVIISFAETYTAIERGVLNGGATGAEAAYGQRWYEVVKYMAGPALSTPMGFETMNKGLWDKFPKDIQQILIEEGAKQELENLRMTPVWIQTGISLNEAKGMVVQPFSPELNKWIVENVTLGRVLPNWIKRVGPEEVKLWNDIYAPLSGIKIEADKSLTKIGGQKVPAAAAAAAAPAGLAAYAAQYANKPGAIYLGDLKQLVGPAPDPSLGDKAGGVPLDSLERHKWIYEGDYYKKLIPTAKLDNPTPLTTTGKSIKLQYACINRTLLPCKLMESYFEPNVLKRTNGQVKIDHSSYPELGIAGPDTLRLVSDGTLSISEIYGGYVSGDLPVAEIFYFWGLYPSHEAEYRAQWDIIPVVDGFVSKGAGGAKVITHNWYAGNDQYFFSKKPLRTLADFKGAKVRSHGTTLTDWIEGVGANAQFVAFAEVYTALERGILGAGVSGATAGHGLRWYEVADYLDGPFRSFPADFIVINKGNWEKLPADIQQILIEEGAKQELEGLRLAAIQNELGLSKNVEAGMEFVPFSPELQAYAYENSIIKRMIPNWVKRVGGADKPEVALFNQIIAPLAGVKINPDGSASKVPITK